MLSQKSLRFVVAFCLLAALATCLYFALDSLRADSGTGSCTCNSNRRAPYSPTSNAASATAAGRRTAKHRASLTTQRLTRRPQKTSYGKMSSSATESLSSTAVPTIANVADDDFIIPNVFHFIRFDQPRVTFVEMLSIMSVLRLNPRLVMIHCNQKPEGEYWDRVSGDKRLVLVHRDPPDDIFGVKPYWIQHKSDLVRIQVLREYGGIYLDNDCIMLRSVDYLRKGHKCVVAKSKRERYLGSMFAMAAVGCRYLAMFEDLYRTRYNASLWYYNAGELPTTDIIEKYPGIALVVDQGIEMDIARRLFVSDEPVEAFTSAYDVLHTLYNHRYIVNDKTDYDKVDYRAYNNSFANIARWLIGD